MAAEVLNLNYRVWGSGNALIMLHGLFGSGVNWQSIGLQLSQQRSVFAPDLRNHGDSPHSPDFGYEAMSEDLNAFMTRQHVERAVLMGHSLGGKIAMAFADRFPEKTEGLIIADIAPKPYPAGHRDILNALIQLDLSRIKSRKEALDALAPAIPSLPVRQFLLQSLRRWADGRYRWKINLDAIDRHLDRLGQGPRLMNQYPGRALFMRGGNSPYITDADAKRIRRYYPNARIVTIDGAGHWLHFDAPEKTIAAINSFVGSAF
jgi:esterase